MTARPKEVGGEAVGGRLGERRGDGADGTVWAASDERMTNPKKLSFYLKPIFISLVLKSYTLITIQNTIVNLL